MTGLGLPRWPRTAPAPAPAPTLTCALSPPRRGVPAQLTSRLSAAARRCPGSVAPRRAARGSCSRPQRPADPSVGSPVAPAAASVATAAAQPRLVSVATPPPGPPRPTPPHPAHCARRPQLLQSARRPTRGKGRRESAPRAPFWSGGGTEPPPAAAAAETPSPPPAGQSGVPGSRTPGVSRHPPPPPSLRWLMTAQQAAALRKGTWPRSHCECVRKNPDALVPSTLDHPVSIQQVFIEGLQFVCPALCSEL